MTFQVKAKPGAGSCPLQMVEYWKCTEAHTDLRLDYKYNGHAMALPCPLLNLSIAVPVSGGVTNMQSQPTGTWYWNFPMRRQENTHHLGKISLYGGSPVLHVMN